MSGRSIHRVAIVGVALSLVLIGCGNVEKSEEYQALLAERDAISADLVTAERDLGASQAENERLSAENAQLQTDVEAAVADAESLGASLDQAKAAMLSARDAARAHALDYIQVDQEAYEGLSEMGVSMAIGDDVVALIAGPWEDMADIASADLTLYWRDMLFELDDEGIEGSFDTWWVSEIGSDEELAAVVNLRLQLHRMVLSALTDGIDGIEGA